MSLENEKTSNDKTKLDASSNNDTNWDLSLLTNLSDLSNEKIKSDANDNNDTNWDLSLLTNLSDL